MNKEIKKYIDTLTVDQLKNNKNINEFMSKIQNERGTISVNLLLNLKHNNFIKPRNAHTIFFDLPHPAGRTYKIKVLVNDEKQAMLYENNTLLLTEDIDNIKRKKIDFDILLSCTNDLATISTVNKILATKKKMPSLEKNTLFSNYQQMLSSFQVWNTGKRRLITINSNKKTSFVDITLTKNCNDYDILLDNLLFVINKFQNTKLLSCDTNKNIFIHQIILSTTRGTTCQIT